MGSMGKGRCGVSMSPEGRWVAAGGADGNVYVWDLVGGSSQRSGGGAGAGARSRGILGAAAGWGLTRGSSGAGAGGGSCDGAVSSAVLKHHKDAVVTTAWGAAGSVLVTGDRAGAVAFWTLESAC
jgi:WD40 repeat protein